MIGAALTGLLAAARRQPWRLTVQTTDVNQTWTVDINGGTSPAIVVEWGDGTTDRYTTTGQKTHTYASAGTYIAKLSGRFASGGNIRFGSVAGDAHRLKATSAVPYIPGLLSFNTTFYGCTGLTGAIPADLFRYNPQISTNGFYLAMNGCTGLTGSIPADLFRYNPEATSFYYALQGCTGLTGAIPADLFRYNTKVSAFGFMSTFRNCTGLTGEIPADLFRYNTLVSTNGFNGTFYACSGLVSAPSLLFAYCPDCTSFNSAFMGCNKLQLPADLFSAAGDKGTRFLNKTVDFTSACRITSAFTGTQGTAPDLWNYDFGTGAATKTLCFNGHSSSSVSNYADIPADWR